MILMTLTHGNRYTFTNSRCSSGKKRQRPVHLPLFSIWEGIQIQQRSMYWSTSDSNGQLKQHLVGKTYNLLLLSQKLNHTNRERQLRLISDLHSCNRGPTSIELKLYSFGIILWIIMLHVTHFIGSQTPINLAAELRYHHRPRKVGQHA